MGWIKESIDKVAATAADGKLRTLESMDDRVICDFACMINHSRVRVVVRTCMAKNGMLDAEVVRQPCPAR